MGTRSLTGRSTDVVDAEVAFCCLLHRLVLFVEDELSATIPDVHHMYILVGAAVGAHRAADAGKIIDEDLAAILVAVDRAGRTLEHADRIDAMHTGIGDHQVGFAVPVTDKARIVVMTRCTCTDAVITSGTTI